MADYRNMYRLLARTVEYAVREIEQGNSAAAVFALSLANIIRIRTTRCLFAPDIILFFDGRQPICIIQFRLTQKSTPVVS